MRRTVLGFVVLVLALTGSLAAGGPAVGDKPPDSGAIARSPELSVATQLADRRSLFVGDRFWGMGAQDGSYPATGFHTRGEMGGFWTPPVKLLDGIWFRAGDSWLTSTKYTSGWGYQRMDLGTHDGVRITRTDFAPDGLRAGLIGLRLDASKATTVAARGRRALRADEGLPLGRDHAQPDDVQPARQRRRRRQRPRLPRAGHAARHQRDPRLRRRRRLDAGPEREQPRAGPPRSPGRDRVRRLRPGHPDPPRRGATTRRTGRAPAAS